MHNKGNAGYKFGVYLFFFILLIAALFKSHSYGAIVLGLLIIFFLFMEIYLPYKEESSKESDEDPAEQPIVTKEQKIRNGSHNLQKENLQTEQINSCIDNHYQKERMDFLIDSFQTLMSKPFPSKYLNYTDSFFNEFYTAIAEIKEYDFKCGYEKEKQLWDKIKTHNTNIVERQPQKLDLLIDSFQTLMSKPFPSKHLNYTDPFLDEFYTTISEIKRYDFKRGYEKEKQLWDKINEHNAYIAKKQLPNKAPVQETESVAEGAIHEKIAQILQEKLLEAFRQAVSKPFPDMYLDINDSFFDYLREELDAIDRVGGNSKEASNLLQERIRKHNEDFITKHLNDPIFSRVCGESLDNEQRRAILCDSKYNLVRAEDGSGKTLTICGKIKYLLENNLAKEEDILVLSYLNTSVDELKDKLSEKYPNLVVKTFHALGSDILSEHYGEKKAVDDQLLAHIKAFFDEKYYKNGEFRDNVARYLSLSPKLPYFTDFIPSNSAEYVNELIDDFKSKDFKVLSKALKSSRDGSKRILTVKKESVKSLEELMVANYLFVNGIKYEYEKPYKFKTATLDKRQYCPDFFLPDYGIYIEHFGTNKFGRARQYSPEEEQEYLRTKEWKEKTHDEFNTVCVKTYSYEFSKKNVFINLKKNLEDKGVKFKQRWTQNRIEELKSAMLNLYGAKDLSKLIYTLEAFLRLYKSQQYRDEVTWIRAGWKDKNERERLKIDSFQKISEQVDDYCISLLKQNNKIDFDDMILQSTKLLDSSEFGRKYCYKYILVDDFHDTTQIIFDFLEKLVEHGNSKLMAVGDNRQAVDRFKNSDIGKILDLKKITFPNAVTNKLTTIYKREYDKMEMVSE